MYGRDADFGEEQTMYVNTNLHDTPTDEPLSKATKPPDMAGIDILKSVRGSRAKAVA